jgi:3',5'-cyclic AMP phosphodiesterase CpdA
VSRGKGARVSRTILLGTAIALGASILSSGGCARVGHLKFVDQPVAPVAPDSTAPGSPAAPSTAAGRAQQRSRIRALFAGDSLVGIIPGTADSSRRYLGRMYQGFTADTMNIMLLGDNRPAYRTARLRPEFIKIKEMVSLNPIKIARGLITIPVVLVKGLYPDLALIRDIPAVITKKPNFGREVDVMRAMTAKIDSLEAQGKIMTAVINTGDLVKDGRYPAHWERFLDLVRPLSRRVSYFPVAGNHERTDTPEGVENWRTGTGLPISGDRLYYCFDSADGWVRFIALDSNPMTDPANRWTREVEIKYSDEQIDWMVARLKEHRGPAFVFLHHPPFSVGFHRVEWENDDALRERRERMVRALYDARIGIMAAGHEHAYERVIFTWPDAALIYIVAGGAGSPLHDIPSPSQSAVMFSQYKVAGATAKPENVYTGEVFHFIHLRLWFGGGDFYTYAVEKDAKVKLIDYVEVDLERYGIPEVDQKKMAVPPKGGPEIPAPPEEGKDKQSVTAGSDSVSASKRIQAQPPPTTR